MSRLASLPNEAIQSLSRQNQLQYVLYSYKREILSRIEKHFSGDFNSGVLCNAAQDGATEQRVHNAFTQLLEELIEIHQQFHDRFSGFDFENVLVALFCISQEERTWNSTSRRRLHFGGKLGATFSRLLHKFIPLFHKEIIFHFTNNNTLLLRKLNQIGFPIEEILIKFINLKIREKTSSDDETLADLLDWLENDIFNLLTELNFDSHQWKLRFKQALYRERSTKLIHNLFNIIVDFPDSIQLIMDLKECLIHTALHNEMVRVLCESNRKRLLHLGAHTNDIIIQYTNIIKTLNILDPTGVSLTLVSHDINSFLRNRKDAIRYFVNSIIDEENDLFEELMNIHDGPAIEEEAAGADMLMASTATMGRTTTNMTDTQPLASSAFFGATSGSAQSDTTFGQQTLAHHPPYLQHFWTPHSLYPDPSKQQTKKPSIINIFVNIFQNVDLFVNEYQSILSQQLLKNTDFDTTNPYKILELLKVRFGENSLQKCEVMLKDIADSKRLFNNIKGGIRVPLPESTFINAFPQQDENQMEISHTFGASTVTQSNGSESMVSAKIISKYFWPPLAEEKCKLHPFFEGLMEQYEQGYSRLKSPRHLSWLPCLGSIEFEIDIGDTSVELSASPVEASILMHLSENHVMSCQQVTQLMEANMEFIEKKLKYWILRGLVERNSEGLYHIVDELDEHFDPDAEVDEEMELKDSEDEIDENVDDFVRGILGHFKKASIDTIHHLLSISIDSFDKTLPQLQKYLCSRTEFFEYDASSREFILLSEDSGAAPT